MDSNGSVCVESGLVVPDSIPKQDNPGESERADWNRRRVSSLEIESEVDDVIRRQSMSEFWKAKPNRIRCRRRTQSESMPTDFPISSRLSLENEIPKFADNFTFLFQNHHGHMANVDFEIVITGRNVIVNLCTCHAELSYASLCQIIRHAKGQIRHMSIQSERNCANKLLFFGIDSSQISTICENCCNLKELHLVKLCLHSLCDEGLLELQECKRLRRIVILDCSGLHPSILKRLVKLKNIEELWIESCEEMNDPMCIVIGTNINYNIHTISLDNCRRISASGLIHIVKAACRRVRQLGISAVGTQALAPTLLSLGMREGFVCYPEKDEEEMMGGDLNHYRPISICNIDSTYQAFVQLTNKGGKMV